MQRRISVPQKGIEAQKLFTEFLGFFIAYDLRGFSDVTWSSLPAAVLQLPEKTYEKESFHNGKQAK